MKLSLLLPVLLLLWNNGVRAFSPSEDNHYTIPSFATADVFPHRPENDIIKGERDTILALVDSIRPADCLPGKLFVRSKRASGEYGVFSGRLDTTALSGRFPLYVFPIPRWAHITDILKYRLYRSPTESIGSDEEVVYFDNERIYSRTSSQLYYYRSGIWFAMNGSRKKPLGSLSVTSVPAGAEVVLNGIQTRKRSPCVIDSLIGGVYSVELALPHYQFFTKTVRVVPDSVTPLSFELIADVDTVFITGDVDYSLLLLPHPPLPMPYIIDDTLSLYGERLRLPPGSHSIKWNGNNRYVSIDTTISVESHKVLYFDYLFRLKYGIVRLVPTPVDAEICIDRFGCSIGERVDELPVGRYRIDAYREGFMGVHKDIIVYPDTVITTEIDLRQVRDSDGDGYLDSVDGCPEVYGLYGGCTMPKFKPILKSMLGDIAEFIENDRFTTGVSLFGFISRTPTNSKFRGFLSNFSDGRTGGVNNYQGITVLNSVECTWRGLYLHGELGQWSSGIRFKRSDTLALDDDHFFYYDSLFGVEPIIYLPSTALSLGVHYTKSWLNVAYSVGFQWEDIVINQLFNRREVVFERLIFNNDWWYHQLSLDIDFTNDERYIPSLYFRMKYPFGDIKQSRWIVLNTGLQLKIAARKRE